MWAPDVYDGSPTSVTVIFAILPKIAALTVFINFLYGPFLEMFDQWQAVIIFLSIGFNGVWSRSCDWTKKIEKTNCL